jgi:hypothetical protein
MSRFKPRRGWEDQWPNLFVTGVGVVLRPVVGREDDEGVLCLSGFFQRPQKLADGIVGLVDEIAVRSGLGFAVKPVIRDDGRVGRGVGEVEEERLSGCPFASGCTGRRGEWFPGCFGKGPNR